MSMTFETKVVEQKGENKFVSGTGTAGQAGSASAAYKPSLWKFDMGMTPVTGDMITFKIPVAGNSSGVWMSIDNGTTYYPIAVSGDGRLTTHYPDGYVITVVFETGFATKLYGNTSAGGAAGATLTSYTLDRWRIYNYSDTDTHRPIQVNGTEILGNNTTALNLKAGSNVSVTNSSGTVTIAATDTTYSSKTAASGGTDVSLVTTGEKYNWSNGQINTNRLVRPNGLRGTGDATIQTLISTARANRLAFLPADQIIIEKTVDGGTTWTDAGVSDASKTALFSETRPAINLPLIDGKRNLLCGLRVTFSAMKYNVPSGTAETQKYNYWSSSYVKTTERYTQLKEFYFWLSSSADTMSIVAQRATGANPNNWETIFNDSSFYMNGWSGADYISFSQGTFGGGTTQTGQPWNYRIIFMTKGVNGTNTLSTASVTQSQSIQEIRGYGDSVWTFSNEYMKSDKLYSVDHNKNATFPARIDATSFNGYTIAKSVPSDAKFTDTTYSAISNTDIDALFS